MRKPSITIILTILTLLAGVGVILTLVAIPALARIVELSRAIDQERARIELARQNARQFRQTSASIDEIKKNLPLLKTLAIDAGKEVDFFAALETQNTRRNLDQLVRLGEPSAPQAGLEELPIEFQLRGAFANITAYLNDLERLSPIVTLKQLDLRESTAADATSQPLTANFQGQIYVRP